MSRTGEPYDTESKRGTPNDASASSGDKDRSDMRATAGKARHEAEKLGDHARQRARSMAEERKSAAADQVHGFADALHKTSDDLRDHNYGAIGDYADDAARRLEDFAQSLRDKDVGTLLSDVEQFARRQPALFLGGAVAAGFALSRFLKASSDRYDRAEGYRYGEDFEDEEYGYYRSEAYRPSPYGAPDYPDTGVERPVPSTTASGSGGTTAGSASLSETDPTESGSSPSTTGRSTTGGTHGNE